jgi:homoprotocatechuate degradation regulator HpaR
MACKKSSGGAGSRPASKASARRVPMREFSRSLPMSLLRAREAVMRHFRPSLRDHGLTEQQWRILRALTSVDAIEVTELARVAFLLGPSLSRILRDLEARHLIDREVVKADQRRVVVSISAASYSKIPKRKNIQGPGSETNRRLSRHAIDTRAVFRSNSETQKGRRKSWLPGEE